MNTTLNFLRVDHYPLVSAHARAIITERTYVLRVCRIVSRIERDDIVLPLPFLGRDLLGPPGRLPRCPRTDLVPALLQIRTDGERRRRRRREGGRRVLADGDYRFLINVGRLRRMGERGDMRLTVVGFLDFIVFRRMVFLAYVARVDVVRGPSSVQALPRVVRRLSVDRRWHREDGVGGGRGQRARG